MTQVQGEDRVEEEDHQTYRADYNGHLEHHIERLSLIIQTDSEIFFDRHFRL